MYSSRFLHPLFTLPLFFHYYSLIFSVASISLSLRCRSIGREGKKYSALSRCFSPGQIGNCLVFYTDIMPSFTGEDYVDNDLSTVGGRYKKVPGDESAFPIRKLITHPDWYYSITSRIFISKNSCYVSLAPGWLKKPCVIDFKFAFSYGQHKNGAPCSRSSC